MPGSTLGNNPLVSIIIPTYNRASLISETLHSVVNQTYKNWELIIIDDGSEDNTKNVIETFRDPRIITLRIPHSGIFGKVRNEGLKISRGEFIAFLDSDDLWMPHKIETQLQLLFDHPEAAFVFSNVELFGSEAGKSPPDYIDLYVGNVLLSILEESQFVFYPSTLLFQRNVLTKSGWMNEVLKYGTDTKYFLGMCQQFKGIFTNQRLVKIRKHGNSTSQKYTAEVFYDSIEIVRSIHKDGSITKEQQNSILSYYYYKLGLAQLQQQNPGQASNSFLSYIKLAPLKWKGWIRFFQAILISVIR